MVNMVPKENDRLTFVVGHYYNSVEEIRTALEAYNKAKWTDFAIVINNRRMLVAKCNYGFKVKETDGSNSSGNMTDHSDTNNISNSSLVCSHNSISCFACMTFHKVFRSGERALKLTKANLSHNHLVRKEWSNLENMVTRQPERDVFTKLRRANEQLSQINSILGRRTAKKVLQHPQQQHYKQLESLGGDGGMTNYDQISIDALQEFLGRLLDNNMEGAKPTNLTDIDKNRIIMPVLSRIGRLITHQPTKQFLSYVHELCMVESSIYCSQHDNNARNHTTATSSTDAFIESTSPTHSISPASPVSPISSRSRSTGSTRSTGSSNSSPRSNIPVPISRRGSGVRVKERCNVYPSRLQSKIATINFNNCRTLEAPTIELNVRLPSFV